MKGGGIVTGMIICVAMATAVWAARLPTESGAIVREQADIVRHRLTPVLSMAGYELKIVVTRDTPLAVAMSDLWMEAAIQPASAMAADASIAFNDGARRDPDDTKKTCAVVVSAQALTGQGPTATLADAIGHQGLAWRLLLSHEVAHCLRPRPAGSGDHRVRLAADRLAESYADAFAAAELWSQDRRRAAAAIQRLLIWRSTASLAPGWRTANAINEALRLLEHAPESPSPIELDALAWTAARRALAKDAGAMPQDEMAQAAIAALMSARGPFDAPGPEEPSPHPQPEAKPHMRTSTTDSPHGHH